MKRFLIVGAGKGGYALLKALLSIDWVDVVCIADQNLQAPGIQLAKEKGIPFLEKYENALTEDLDVIMEATGDLEVYRDLEFRKSTSTLLIPGTVANIVMALVQEKEDLIHLLARKSNELDTILHSTHDAMIAVNRSGIITLFNRSAERLMGLKEEDVMGTKALDTIPNSRLHFVLESGEPELNREQVLGNQKRIITNRVPVKDKQGMIVGAVAVFRDITDVQALAEQIMDLKGIRSFLEAIINSSEDAISVVDHLGNGVLINPAYTRLTGLCSEDIIGKPASVDISEGESMHMKVLQTKKPFRGVHMKVGPMKKDVIVNVAPVIVEGQLKGSVGVIHDKSEFMQLAAELEQAKRIIRTLEAKYTFDDIIAGSKLMEVAVDQARRAALTPATVLLRGESGTGKEVFAHAIHNDSRRKFNQFIRVNCAALPDPLLESELFGYEEGAFTGAKKGGKRGLFEEANGGTIFLDEIGEMTYNTQAKLLRVLQEKEIVRVGGSKPIPVNVRIIAATNVNLERAIQKGTFREDLYYRLNVLPINIPPLRYRLQDILPLTVHITRKINQEFGRAVTGIHEQALHLLTSYDWPGNVRELENVLGRSIINMKYAENEIMAYHLPDLQLGQRQENVKKQTSHGNKEWEGKKLSEVLDQVEKEVISKTYEQLGFNKTKTAKQLGLSIRNLYYKMERYGIF